MARLINRFDAGRLRWLLSLFFLALSVPTAILIYRSYDQLKWEAFHQHRVMAEELAARIDLRAIELIVSEEAQSFADYSFLIVAGDARTNFVQHSPLSTYPIASAVPGLVGYFQVDAAGTFSSPLVPPAGSEPGTFGISEEEYAARRALERNIRDVLSHNRLIRARRVEDIAFNEAPVESGLRRGLADSFEVSPDQDALLFSAGAAASVPVGQFADDEVDEQLAFDNLKKSKARAYDASAEAPKPAAEKSETRRRSNTLGRLNDWKLDSAYEGKSLEQAQRQARPASVTETYRREKRKEQSVVPAPQIKGGEALGGRGRADVGITTFESEIDPFEFSMLDSGHFVLFRKVWRDGQRYIQGALIEQRPFIDGIVGTAFNATALSRMSDLIVAYQDDVVSAFVGDPERDYLSASDELRGALLYQTPLSAPLGDLQLIFSITELPAGPGG
ncbi:MAG: hypothetical protein V3U43_07130, partial [Pseudomonadales bacterium]